MSATGISYKEDLVTRIRDLIDGYDSSSLLKEYLQNADDSGATELIITFDKRNHQKVHGTEFAFSNSPALLLSNDSIFKDKDFENIVKISSQGKVEDALATGRFGQGFSSSFSISDHPSFISNDRAYWFDVRKNAVSKDLDYDILQWDRESFSDIELWLETFLDSGLTSVLEKRKTIFRLPLRTKEYVEADTDSLNKISDEVFTYEDFLNWCDEWKDKAENLLFLRSVHKLVLQEIDTNGNIIVHLSLETDNYQEIRKINKSIESEFDGTLVDICNKWNETDKELPLFKYKQHFTISYLSRDDNAVIESKENWAIVNGLFRGENNVLIDQALKALKISPNPRKVLPWAGAAIQLDENNLPIKKKDNQWYTFLPLPLDSSHPVHLHGWFDLNPKRTEITSGGSGHDKETLTQWNALLMENGVGPAWAMLIDYVKTEQGLNDYYGFWAKSKGGSSLDKHLVKGFYSVVSKLKSFYVELKDEKSWRKPDTETFLFQDDDLILHEAFREHFKIIIPKPNGDIVKGLKSVKLDLPVIDSSYIRAYIKEVSGALTFPVLLKDIGITMLARKIWFMSIASYCADHGSDYSKLDDLPFQLTLNGQVSLVNSCDVVFGTNINLELLQNKKELILDLELANDIENVDDIPSSWLHVNLKNIIYLIHTNFDEFDLNMDWVEQLSNFIYEHKSELHNVKTMLGNMRIVLQEDNQWGTMRNDVVNHSPILIKEKDIDSIGILETIGLNLVNHEYISVYKPLASVYAHLAESELLAKLSSYTLSKYILSIEDYSFFEDQAVREYVLDILTEKTSWYDNLDKKKKNKLERIPFIHTVSDNVYSFENAKLFISTNFNPPKHIKGLKSDYDLIDTTDPKHLELYKKMGIKEQTPETYIREIIIPFLENSTDEKECLDVLGWLSLEWYTISSTLDVESLYTLIDLLNKSRIIPTQDNFIKKRANEIYDPTFSYDLPECLDDEKYKVIYFEDHNEQITWKNFLQVLDLKKEVMPEHIIHKVNQIVSNNIDVESYKSSIEKSVCLSRYLIANIEYFDTLVYLNKPLFDALKQYVWLPAKHPKHFLIHPDKTYSPLMQGSELVNPFYAKIASGEYYVLMDVIKLQSNSPKFQPRDIARRLGIVTDLNDNEVFENFRKLINFGLSNSEENEDELLSYTKEFYAFLGRKHKLMADEIPNDIRQKSIRINENWVSVDRVFKQPIKKLRGVYDWNFLLQGYDNKFHHDIVNGLDLLGVKDKPDLSLFAGLLNELPVGETLSKDDLKQGRILLKEIYKVDDLSNIDMPILTTENKLINWEDMYINDLPAYEHSSYKNTNFFFCHKDFVRLANKLNVDSLSKEHASTLNVDETIFIDTKESYSIEIDRFINKKYFKEVLLRLLYHEDKIKDEEISEDTLIEILTLEIVSVEKLVVDYSVYGKFLFQDHDSTTYEENTTLYILEQDDREDMIESIAMYISSSFEFSQENMLLIRKIIFNNMIQTEISDLLDKKHIKSLPKELNVEDENIYDDNVTYEFPDKITDQGDSNEITVSDDELLQDSEAAEPEDDFKDNIEGLDGKQGNIETYTENTDKEDQVPKIEKSTKKKNITSKNNSTFNTNIRPPITPEKSKNKDSQEKEGNKIGDTKTNRNGTFTQGANVLSPITPKQPKDLDLDTILGAIDPNEDNKNKEPGKDIAPPTTPKQPTNQNCSTNTSNVSTNGDNGRNKNTNNSFGNGTNNNSANDNKTIPSANNRMPVYVAKDNEEYDEEKAKERQRVAKERGDKGEDLIVKRANLKLSKDNIVEKAPQNNAGFDLVEKTANGDIVRYIEVKTLSGEWREGGVSLTPVQLKYAMSQQDKWWLFVVEGLELENPVVHQLKNPVLEANKFMFDDGWKQLAINPNNMEKNTVEIKMPKEGELYIVNENGEDVKYEIIKVRQSGAITKILAKKEGEERAKVIEFNESWEKYSA